jgi:hypothetical protein
MPLPEALWQQEVQRLAQRLVRRVPEEGLGLEVDHADPAGVVNDHDGVGHGIHKLAQVLLAQNQGR